MAYNSLLEENFTTHKVYWINQGISKVMDKLIFMQQERDNLNWNHEYQLLGILYSLTRQLPVWDKGELST